MRVYNAFLAASLAGGLPLCLCSTLSATLESSLNTRSLVVCRKGFFFYWKSTDLKFFTLTLTRLKAPPLE